MTEFAEVKGWIAAILKGAGFKGRGSIWRLRGAEESRVVRR